MPPGLAQRIAFALYFAWIAVLALALLRSGQVRRVSRASRVNEVWERALPCREANTVGQALRACPAFQPAKE